VKHIQVAGIHWLGSAFWIRRVLVRAQEGQLAFLRPPDAARNQMVALRALPVSLMTAGDQGAGGRFLDLARESEDLGPEIAAQVDALREKATEGGKLMGAMPEENSVGTVPQEPLKIR
jgi:hypothetical protein